jgi:FKBP-type peptidyl-prolyl cis-trans isomerase FkpA
VSGIFRPQTAANGAFPSVKLLIMITQYRTRGRGLLLCAFAACLLAAGCGSSTAPSSTVAFSQTDLRVGTGADAVAGKSLTVSYNGWLYDSTQTDNKGTLFQSSPGFTFTLGTGAVIAGWDRGIPGMKVGGLRRLTIPPDLAYGSSGSGAIPPNAALVFEIGLLNVQ